MKKIITAIVAGIGACVGIIPHCEGAVESDYSFDDLLRAIAIVESSGDPKAFNKKESAAGLYQIRPIYLKDVNRILGYQRYKLADRYNPEKARDIVTVYLMHYGYGKGIEAMARIHNGGPRGWKKKFTLVYWQKIKEVLNDLH